MIEIHGAIVALCVFPLVVGIVVIAILIYEGVKELFERLIRFSTRIVRDEYEKYQIVFANNAERIASLEQELRTMGENQGK